MNELIQTSTSLSQASELLVQASNADTSSLGDLAVMVLSISFFLFIGVLTYFSEKAREAEFVDEAKRKRYSKITNQIFGWGLAGLVGLASGALWHESNYRDTYIEKHASAVSLAKTIVSHATNKAESELKADDHTSAVPLIKQASSILSGTENDLNVAVLEALLREANIQSPVSTLTDLNARIVQIDKEQNKVFLVASVSTLLLLIAFLLGYDKLHTMKKLGVHLVPREIGIFTGGFAIIVAVVSAVPDTDGLNLTAFNEQATAEEKIALSVLTNFTTDYLDRQDSDFQTLSVVSASFVRQIGVNRMAASSMDVLAESSNLQAVESTLTAQIINWQQSQGSGG